MARIWLIFTLVYISLSALPAHAATRNFTLANFDSIKVEGDMDVTVTTGNSVKARASGSADTVRRLDLRVQNRTLFVRFNSAESSRPLRTEKQIPVTVVISAREVRDIEVIGDADVRIDRISGRLAQASLYGGGILAIGDMDVAGLQLNFNGIGGRLTASGNAKDVRAVSRGKGILDASSLYSETLYIIGEGPVISQFNATQTAQIIVSIDAKVRVNGGAKCDVQAGGNSEVICEPA